MENEIRDHLERQLKLIENLNEICQKQTEMIDSLNKRIDLLDMRVDRII